MNEQHDAHVRVWKEMEAKEMEADRALDRHLQRIEDSYGEY
jgi:hypothetical protein